MQFHYYTLLHFSSYLNQSHRGSRVVSAFSQNKNELILELESLFLRIGCNTPLSYVVPIDQFAQARKNVAELFSEMYGLCLQNCRVVSYERVLILELEQNYELILKMHGIAANVLLRKAGKIEVIFNQNIADDWEYEEEAGYYYPEKILQLPTPDSPKTALQHLREVAPIFDKQFGEKLFALCQSGKDFAAAYHALHEEVAQQSYYLQKEGKKIQFLLFKPWQTDAYRSHQGIAEALQYYLRFHFQLIRYRSDYTQLQEHVIKPYRKYEKVYKSYRKNIEHLETERNPEELGHLLMANLHLIESGAKSIEVEDFYEGGKLKIKLKPELNPQDNATQYYEKHKQRKLRLAYLKSELDDIENKYLEAAADFEAFQATPSPADLRFDAQGFDREALLQMKENAKLLRKHQKTEAAQRYPFRNFQLQGYQIFVGKNGRNNDELSFKFASKEDLWLHAKDVPGSHVVIRQKAGQPIPIPVLEYAAQLAAYYSKRKQDSLVPVQYTPRKYIRKRKGDPPGMVVVSREQVIMVEPLRN